MTRCTRIAGRWFGGDGRSAPSREAGRTARVAGTIAAAALALLAARALAAGAPPLPLAPVADIALPGPASRFDYQAYDARTHRLFVAHLGAGTVVVVDVEAQRVVAEIANLKSVHGVLVVPELDRVYATATGTNEVVAIDARTLRERARIPGGVYPDGLAYAPELGKLYVSDESGRTETVIDARSERLVATVALGGEAGNTQYDPGSGHVFVNVQTSGELVEIDPATDAVVGRHRLAGAQGNHGLLIDPAARIAYVACEGNARLLTVDLDSKQVLAEERVGSAPDVLALDPGLRLLYVASESGVVSVFDVKGRTPRKIGEGLLARHAHSVSVDPATHRVYFPLEDVEGRAVLRVTTPVAR